MERRINLTRPTVNSAGGMRPFLDLDEIKAKHNGLGTDDLIRKYQEGVTKERIMHDFNIHSPNTLKRYLLELGLIEK